MSPLEWLTEVYALTAAFPEAIPPDKAERLQNAITWQESRR